MGTKLYVGNLAWGVTDQDLGQAFSGVGTVKSAKVIMDRDTNRSKGFGFVEMSSEDEAAAAISQLNNADLSGRALKVNMATPKPQGGGFNNSRPNYDRPRRDQARRDW